MFLSFIEKQGLLLGNQGEVVGVARAYDAPSGRPHAAKPCNALPDALNAVDPCHQPRRLKIGQATPHGARDASCGLGNPFIGGEATPVLEIGEREQEGAENIDGGAGDLALSPGLSASHMHAGAVVPVNRGLPPVREQLGAARA